jgi:hypothetical protein
VLLVVNFADAFARFFYGFGKLAGGLRGILSTRYRTSSIHIYRADIRVKIDHNFDPLIAL